MNSDLRYPVGPFETVGRPLNPDERRQALDDIRRTPGALREALSGLDDERLDTPYRPGGWTVRQVAHHLPDSHLNAYLRFRWALTEDEPAIRPYDEKKWAELPDGRGGGVEVSLRLLEALHERWMRLLETLDPEAFGRTLRHPDFPDPLTLDFLLEMYSWHGRHHVGHILALRERKGWRG